MELSEEREKVMLESGWSVGKVVITLLFGGATGLGSYAVAPVVTEAKLQEAVATELNRPDGVWAEIRAHEVRFAKDDTREQSNSEFRKGVSEELERAREDRHELDKKVERLDERVEHTKDAVDDNSKKLDRILERLPRQ